MEIRLEPCGCTVQQDHDARVHVEYCPKHKSAPDLYEALKFAKPYIAKMIADNVNTAIPPEQAYKRIELALAKAESK